MVWCPISLLVFNHLALDLDHPTTELVPQPDHRHHVLVGPGLQHVIPLGSAGPAQLQVLRRLAEERGPAYETAADVVLDTDGLTVDEVGCMVIDAVAATGGVPR